MAVLVCIPLAFIGSFGGMFLFGKQWDLAALVGLLMLTGIVVVGGMISSTFISLLIIPITYEWMMKRKSLHAMKKSDSSFDDRQVLA